MDSIYCSLPSPVSSNKENKKIPSLYLQLIKFPSLYLQLIKWKEMKETNHKNNKKKVNNAARDKRRKEARNKRKQLWHDPVINTFGVRVQNYQGIFFTKGTEAAEAPNFNAFNKKLDNHRNYCKHVQIDRVVSR